MHPHHPSEEKGWTLGAPETAQALEEADERSISAITARHVQAKGLRYDKLTSTDILGIQRLQIRELLPPKDVAPPQEVHNHYDLSGSKIGRGSSVFGSPVYHDHSTTTPIDMFLALCKFHVVPRRRRNPLHLLIVGRLVRLRRPFHVILRLRFRVRVGQQAPPSRRLLPPTALWI